MTILSTRATPIAVALCLAFAAPAATHAADFGQSKNSPVIGDLPDTPKLATPAPPSAAGRDMLKEDYTVWHAGGGHSVNPRVAQPGARTPQTPGGPRRK